MIKAFGLILFAMLAYSDYFNWIGAMIVAVFATWCLEKLESQKESKQNGKQN